MHKMRVTLNELDVHIWRALALLLPDPTSFASCCKRGSQAVNDEGFRSEWFAVHHRSRAPDRPWQYAALTWQLHRHASPEQIAAFILRFHAWRQQNMVAGLANQASDVTTASCSPAAASAAAARAAPGRARTMLQRQQRCESNFSLPLECRLLPSTVRRAQQMLAKDRALDALYGLCPASASLLFAYAAKSCNKDLMRQLLQRHATLREGFMFPQHWFKGAAGGIYLRTDLVCSLAALASGDLQMLRQLLPLSAGNYKEGWRSRLLLCYAARHRSAECLQEVLAARQAHAVCTQCTPLVAPQHLAMAAARTDPWAAGAVSQLLQALTPKQRKPANMRPAYKAACSSGCMPVLAALASVAAAVPRQHLPVLLEAAAEAGNLQAWRQLLQADSSIEQQQQGEAVAAAFPRLDWSCLTLEQLTSGLHLALPRRYGESRHRPGTSQQQHWEAAEDASRLQMADLLWQQLVVQQGRETALRQYLSAPAPAKHRGTQHPAYAADAAADAAAAAKGLPTAPRPGADVNSRLLFCYNAGESSWLSQFQWWELSAARVVWLQQHQLVPEQQQQIAYCALKSAMELAIEAGDFAGALKLHNTLQGLKGVEQHHMIMRVGSVYEGSIGGHLRRACAAGDAAAVAQLERLAGFARHTFFSIKLTLQQPELLRNLLGGFHGRAVTPGTLAAELGLPWALLQRLLMQRADTIQAQFADSRTPEAQQVQRDELLEAVQHTLMLAQDQAVTAQQLCFAASRALITAMNALQVDDEPAADDAQPQQDGAAAGAAENAPAAAGAAGGAVNNPAEQEEQQQQQQNQEDAQANAVQQIVAVLQQEGALAEEIAHFQAAAAAVAPEEPLPEEDDSDAAVLRQLQARLDAGERSIPVPKQAQLGPLPLWQQCMLELVATHLPFARDEVAANGLYAYLTTGILVADASAAAEAAAAAGRTTACAGVTTPLQRLLNDARFVTGPPVTPQPPRLPWGRLVAQGAVELRLPQLLAWALQPEQRQRLWGSADNAAMAAVVDLMRQDCTPISNAVSRQPQQQRADLLQLQTHQQQLLPGRPAFAQLAAETALLLLDVTPNDEGLLSDWLQHGLQPGSSAADLARAKAVLAGVVAAKQLLVGAKVLHRDCLRQVQRLGDVDLLALVVLWGHRLPQAGV